MVSTNSELLKLKLVDCGAKRVLLWRNTISHAPPRGSGVSVRQIHKRDKLEKLIDLLFAITIINARRIHGDRLN